MTARFRAAALWAAVFVATAALGARGIVTDEQGRPLPGAKACLMTGPSPSMCVETDTQGYYLLPDSSIPRVKIVLSGYVTAEVAAVDQEPPIVLRRAAALRVRVVDASGAAVGGGKVVVSYSSGHEIDPFPFNRAGVRVATIEPGSALVKVSLDGYRQVAPVPVTLVAGEEAAVTITLEKVP